jgi:hypothetical protein
MALGHWAKESAESLSVVYAHMRWREFFQQRSVCSIKGNGGHNTLIALPDRAPDALRRRGL